MISEGLTVPLTVPVTEITEAQRWSRESSSQPRVLERKVSFKNRHRIDTFRRTSTENFIAGRLLLKGSSKGVF